MLRDYLEGSINPCNIYKTIRHNVKFNKEHPNYFKPEGITVFCGAQGSGKTLSAVQFIEKLTFDYPQAILVTNTEMKNINFMTEVREYTGLDCLLDIENGEKGVIYFIDEIHLEMNSLESKNLSMDVIVELSQQRKQRKLIVGTSQVFMRMAKPLREQIKHVILCKNYFHVLQFNRYIDNEYAYEKDGKLVSDRSKVYWWFHSPSLYNSYNTYAKMKRYKNEWRSGSDKQNIYENDNVIKLDVGGSGK